MNVREALDQTSRSLQASGISDARMESEFLVAAALDIPRTHLILQKDVALDSPAHTRIQQWTNRRTQRQPLAYITGEQPFLDLSLQVTPAVLIPRPETELLVERALHVLDALGHSAIVADVGTGSGNIAIALARHPRVRQVVAIDLSHDALALAQDNASRCGVHNRCQWLQGDLLHPVQDYPEPFDLIAANLPYIRTDEMPGLQPEVKQEPVLALHGGLTGLELINRLLLPAQERLCSGGILLLEIGAGQASAVEERLRRNNGWSSIETFNDLAGWPRVIQATKA